MEGMEPHTNVELVFSTVLDHVFVGADATSFQCLTAKLFILIRHQVYAKWEVLYASLLLAQVKNPDLSIGDTTTEPRLRIWLVLTIPITGTSETTSKLPYNIKGGQK